MSFLTQHQLLSRKMFSKSHGESLRKYWKLFHHEHKLHRIRKYRFILLYQTILQGWAREGEREREREMQWQMCVNVSG